MLCFLKSDILTQKGRYHGQMSLIVIVLVREALIYSKMTDSLHKQISTAAVDGLF